jgi:ketosteroid isomerase-like protein
MTATRDRLETQALGYMAALDRFDHDAVCAFFADDAELIVQTGGITVRGVAAIRELWDMIFAMHERMAHRIAAVVVDPIARKVATEQTFTGVLNDGTVEERHSAYFFDFDDRDAFTRVIVWIDGETPGTQPVAPATGDSP